MEKHIKEAVEAYLNANKASYSRSSLGRICGIKNGVLARLLKGKPKLGVDDAFAILRIIDPALTILKQHLP